MAENQRKLQIAISGGGLASLCLAFSLLKSARFEVAIYEASESFREESAAIGLGCNAQEALNLISPELRGALDEAGGVRMSPSARLMMGYGSDCGLHVGDITSKVPQIVVHRGAFWRALRKKLPNEIIRFGKRLSNIEKFNTAGKPAVVLHFEDGSSFPADALVGCDGINSVTRKWVLDNDPAAEPIFTKGYGHRTVISMETARRTFGQEYCDLHTQHAWIGPNAVLITDVIDNGESMQCIVGGLSSDKAWPHPMPWAEWPKDDLKGKLADWGPFGQQMLKAFLDQPKLYAAPGRIHIDTPTFCKGRICLAGDAAHTFLPTQGAGAGQAIEDSLMLSGVLGACSTADDIESAFKAYDALRRPRRLDVARSSARAAMILTGQLPGFGMNPEKIAETLPDWASNIYQYDLKGAQDEALRKMKEA